MTTKRGHLVVKGLATVALTLVSAIGLAAPAAWTVDAGQSTVQWTGSKVIGSSHTGKVKVKSGEVATDGDRVTGGQVIVDLASVTNEDLTDAKYNKKLVDHLKSEDFFDVAKHPEATLSLNKVEALGAGRFKVQATLKIKGVEQPVAFEATETAGDKDRSIEADLAFDRTLFNIRYGSGKFFTNLGDKMIADEVKLKVRLLLKPGAQTAGK